MASLAEIFPKNSTFTNYICNIFLVLRVPPNDIINLRPDESPLSTKMHEYQTCALVRQRQ